jgi:hypothetical protein
MGELKEERLKEEIEQAGISLILDTYDDIFSDFDPRPYGERALSDDFLLECNRAARDKVEGGFELVFSMPRNKRIINDEIRIKKRLIEHFKKHAFKKELEVRKIKNEGILWVLIGALLMIALAFVKTFSMQYWINLLVLVLEPAAWFSSWEGLYKIFITSKEKQPDADFYRKMASARIIFRSY